MSSKGPFGLRVAAGILAMAAGLFAGPTACAQDLAAGVSLTLDSSAVRMVFERGRPGFKHLPDIRIKLHQPEEIAVTPLELNPQVRGIEIRLPLTRVWIGYERLDDDEEPHRVTVSLRRKY